MYRVAIVYEDKEVLARCFPLQRDIIEFTNHLITYNDFKKRKGPKKYKTYKDFFKIQKI